MRKPFPWTKTLGAVCAASGALALFTASQYPHIAYWSGAVNVMCNAAGIFLARSNSTSDEHAGAVPAPSAIDPRLTSNILKQ